jgi:hypothetical protein
MDGNGGRPQGSLPPVLTARVPTDGRVPRQGWDAAISRYVHQDW